MKNILIFLVVFSSLSCQDEQWGVDQVKEGDLTQSLESNALSAMLLNEITQFIDSTVDEENSGNLKGVVKVEFEHRNDDLTVDLSFSYFVDQDSMDGFLLYKDRIAVFYNIHHIRDISNFSLQPEDSIPSRFILKKDRLPIPYESQFRRYILISSDRLLLKDSGYR